MFSSRKPVSIVKNKRFLLICCESERANYKYCVHNSGSTIILIVLTLFMYSISCEKSNVRRKLYSHRIKNELGQTPAEMTYSVASQALPPFNAKHACSYQIER